MKKKECMKAYTPDKMHGGNKISCSNKHCKEYPLCDKIEARLLKIADEVIDDINTIVKRRFRLR